MPNPISEQALRRDAIRQMLQHAPAATQQSLVDALRAQGLVATQSSVSRDLKELGAIKTRQGYELPGSDTAAQDELVAAAVFLREVQPAGPNLTVIKTAIGAAQRVALALDRSNWPEMVGNIGGDDTVFVATDSAASQKVIIARIERARA
ncbi:MAG: arginine repressor [Proteobacteria bacterium]|nr:arginine repressor [Pseudomonadota bacterium]